MNTHSVNSKSLFSLGYKAQSEPKNGPGRVLPNQGSPEQNRPPLQRRPNRQAVLNSLMLSRSTTRDRWLARGHITNHFEATFTVTLLFARFESSCGEAVWTVAVFAISCAGPEAATVNVIVA